MWTDANAHEKIKKWQKISKTVLNLDLLKLKAIMKNLCSEKVAPEFKKNILKFFNALVDRELKPGVRKIFIFKGHLEIYCLLIRSQSINFWHVYKKYLNFT